jgi:hypothetical protein
MSTEPHLRRSIYRQGGRNTGRTALGMSMEDCIALLMSRYRAAAKRVDSVAARGFGSGLTGPTKCWSTSNRAQRHRH